MNLTYNNYKKAATHEFDDDDDNQWHYSPEGRKPPLIQFHSLS
jgi:hypothetical protein